MENQKIINLLDKDDTDSKHFAIKKWSIINEENNTNYGVDKDTCANNPDTIKYDTRVLKPNLCDYAEAYILVDGKIRAIPGAAVGNPPAVPALNLTLNLNVYYQVMMVMLYLLSMIQNYTFQLLLCQKKIIKILLNNKIKVFKDLFIGMNIKQKNKLRMLMLMPLNILI